MEAGPWCPGRWVWVGPPQVGVSAAGDRAAVCGEGGGVVKEVRRSIKSKKGKGKDERRTGRRNAIQ